MSARVVVVGGTGNFGARICRRLGHESVWRSLRCKGV